MTDGSDTAEQTPEAVGQTRDVLIVGGGVAGLTAAVFTARAGFDTLVVNHGESILRRNAHLENFPGFPAGVNSRLFADMLEAQATRSGADLRTGKVTNLLREDGEFYAELSEADIGSDSFPADDVVGADRVIAASWADSSYVEELDVGLRSAGSKQYIEPDGDGQTSLDGLYAAGRLNEKYHQAIVAAGHGAQVAITLIHDSEVPFYHDWVVPEGYFSDRGREVPPGCEEIDETERRAREEESMAAMQEYFAERHDERQRTHPSLVDDERGRLPEEE